MKPGLVIGVFVGYTALASLGSALSPWVKNQFFPRLPFSRLTLGLLFLLCIHVFLLGLLKFHQHNIFRSAFHCLGILMVVLFFVSMGRDFYSARNRPMKPWLFVGFIMLISFLVSMLYFYYSSRAHVHASDADSPTNSVTEAK